MNSEDRAQNEDKSSHNIELVPESPDFELKSEDFLPTPKRPPMGFEKMPRPGSALPGAFFFAAMTGISLLSWYAGPEFQNFDVTKSSVFETHQYWRLLSALFVHGDYLHLLHNLPVYLFFAWVLQGYFGLFASVVLPIQIGILSNLTTIYFYDDHVHLLGASGMIYGMASLWLVLYVRFDRGNWWVKRVMRAVGFSLLVLFPQTYDPKVSYLAHFTGFIFGVVLALTSIPILKRMAPVLRDDDQNHVDGLLKDV